MDIVILANFTMDFSISDNGRFSYLANLLSIDNDVEIITSDFYHITKKKRECIPTDLPYKVTFLPEPGYPRNVCLKRFRSHRVWGKNVKKYLESRKKPDVVYSSVPSLDGPFWTAKFCEKNNIRFVIDVQDLWPEAFQMVLHIPVLSDLFFLPFRLKANGIYKRADAICAVSNTYCQRALRVSRKCKEGTTVFLGTELDTFDRYAAENPVLEKREGEIWLAYCGTLGSSYDLSCVIDALEELSDPRLRLIVMGDGPRKAEFENYAKDKNVSTEFVGRLQYGAMCSLLSVCDITINPIAHMAAQSIINKHADYAASGKPVVSTQENGEYQKLISTYQMGYNCNNNDSADLAEKIKILTEDQALRQMMGVNARRCAEENFDRKETYKLLVCQILENAGGGYCGLVKCEGEMWLGYAGTLGTSYDLPLVFEALRKVNNPHLRFIIMGDGPKLDEFKELAAGLNTTFTGYLSYERMCGVLMACDMVINPIISTSVATIINKHADYAACGRPVINTQNSDEYRALVTEYKMGFNCDDENNIASSINHLVRDPMLKVCMGNNARFCAEEKFNRALTYRYLAGVIRE